MKLEKKVKIMQQMIDDKDKEIATLKEENERLEGELLFECNIPNEGYEKAKELIKELGEKIAVYNRIIKETETAKQEYSKNLEELLLARKDYEKKINSIYRVVSKSAI